MLCENCGKEFFEDWRKDVSQRKKPMRFCSSSCSHARVHTEEQRRRVSETLKKTRANNPRPLKTYFTSCIVCGNKIEYRAGKTCPKTCSSFCRNYLHSLNRQKAIQKNGTFSTERRLFTYKHITIECDSRLEEAGIIYLVDILEATKIERYRNLLNFYEGDVHRTFNPDFWVEKNSEAFIVEVKMLWTEKSDHPYNRTMPLKKIVLENFAKSKGITSIWLDFDYDEAFKKIYRDHLKSI